MTDRTTSRAGLLAAGAASSYLAYRAVKRGRYSFKGRTVVITGASRGLGLLMARRLAREGARLALIARHLDDLTRAARELRCFTGVGIYACDIRSRLDVDQTVANIVSEMGTIDVLINNAGVIQSGPIEHTTLDDFNNAMATHFWGPLFMIRASLPFLETPGRIVNIASIGGKIAVPHLAPYCASKFALVGLSDSLRNELAASGIAVTTVCPGLMRVGSHIGAIFKGDHEREFMAFSLGAATPLTAMSGNRAARKIIEACRRGDASLTLGVQAKTGALLNTVAPGLMARTMELANWVLPKPNGAAGDVGIPGWQLRSARKRHLVTALIDRAAARNNETASLHL